MKIIDRIKNFFRKGGYTLTGQTLKTINDHPKINIDPEELDRIRRTFDEYKGRYPKVEYINSTGERQTRDYRTLNMIKTSAELMAGLVFNEQCEIVISDSTEDKETNTYKVADDFIQEVFEHNDFKKNLSEYLEPVYAVGGLAVRPYVDMATGKIELSWALADAFYPLKSNSGGISEGVIKSTTALIENGEHVFYTLLEFHEWEKDIEGNNIYIITNELYKSDTKNEIGKKVPLGELYEELEEETYIKGLSRPLFNYVTPYGFNNINPHSALGLGITDNSKDTLKQINDTYDQFWWEIKMGQRTVFVSDQMLKTLPDESGMPPKQIFDPDVNIYKAMRMNMDEEFVKDVTHDIRTEQYTTAINYLFRILEMELKLSVGTFSFDGRSMKTATEVVSEDTLTFRTRNNHVGNVEKFIKGLITSILELGKATVWNGAKIFNGEIPTDEHIGVDFDDGVFQSRDALLTFYGKAKLFGFMPTIEIIQRIFKVPKETAEEWMKEIEQEQTEMDPIAISERASRRLFGEEE